MRPVRLDMTGFASFREPAVVDFTDADYFALVGPTGSGKSTVIDAMTFALYGSAPRWGKSNAIADALAPTTTRCTVRLVFDLGAHRYVVAREVRRSGKTVQQKNVVLERLLDPTGTGIDGEPSEVIAGELKEVNRSIESLLGLSFSDFCQCIVLPQGQFAEFLKATPKERQEILLKLLGAGHYEAIARSATARAGLAAEKATVLAAQLGDLAEATEEAEAAAAARVTELDELSAAVEAALPVIAERTTRWQEATAERDRLLVEQERLTRERVPDGVADLQARLDSADRERSAAVEQETAAVAEDTRTRADLASGPSRPRLETMIDRQQEFARLTADRPATTSADRTAAEHQDAASARVTSADQAVVEAREARDQARQVLAEATAAVEQLRERQGRLSAVRVPDGVEALGARTAQARQDRSDAVRRRETAEAADQQAREAVRQAPARGPLEQARADLAEAERLRAGLDRLSARQEQHLGALATAEGRLGQTREQVAAFRQAYEDAVNSRTAATLRPHLVSGRPCPVCEQTVAVLPPPLAGAELDAARQDLKEAEERQAAAQAELAEATRAEAVTTAEIRSTTEQLDKVTAALQDRPKDVAAITAELARLDGLAGALDQAADELSAARVTERAAGDALDQIARLTSAARTQLVAAHGPLIASGAPPLDDSDLPAAWTVLTTWTGEQLQELESRQQPAAKAVTEAAAIRQNTATQVLGTAEGELRAARAEHTEAVQARVRAAGRLQQLSDRLSELETLLAGALSVEEATGQLAECERLETAAQHSDQQLRAARAARVAADSTRDSWNAKADQARRELRSARDRLVPLGAPDLDDANLAEAWAGLLAWASAQATTRQEQLPEVTGRIEQAASERDSATDALRGQVVSHGLEFAESEAPAVLPARLAAGLERARAHTRQISEKRSRAATLTKGLAEAREQQDVATLLAGLLRSDKFPRWLASAALDTLVADASAALSDLSGGQFDLTHDRGDFVVIDHADADSRRSVRTLSGGETFQASLALALALSAQLSTLAAEGAARLDSIFLDEGFGTLDPETLEVVAGTLENLAHGERMVGVITHVAALADRAPVRFAVHRDNRTSSIVREGV